ncbi:MAG TPA: hypothetical protein PKB10_10035 [Tepidisphaeraceae bacterium]|nr:hypothetical protein [Tepidisphaeraceae bacterium]
MIRGTIAAVALTAMLVLVGCGAQPGRTIVKYNHTDAQNRVTEAPEAGMYSLYSTTDANPIISYRLERGDRLGFERGDDGQLYAVAGDNRTRVETTAVAARNYYWNLRRE